MNTTASASAEPGLNLQEVGKVLLIDNYDSFTFNIRGALAAIGVDVTVMRNDEITLEEVEAMNPSHIILGPGPGTPERPEDIGVTSEVIDYAIRERKALLGVCLGHQAIGHHFGARIVQADEILHGKTSHLNMLSMPEEAPYPSILEGVDPEKDVMRYHSLAVDVNTLSQEFLITATSRDQYRTIMALQHESLPIAGVQFHPESFATAEGRRMLENFLQFNPEAFEDLIARGVSHVEEGAALLALDPRVVERIAQTETGEYRELEFACDLPPAEVYARLHGGSDHMFCFESLGENGGQLSYFGAEPAFVLSARNEEFYMDDERMDPNGGAYDALMSAVEAMKHKATTASTNVRVAPGQKFSGGFAGGIAYEAVQYSEPTALLPDERTPEGEKTFSFGYYPDGLVYNGETNTYTYFTRGPDRRAYFQGLLQREASQEETVIVPETTGMPQEEFERRVEEIRDEKIRTGESFQVVLSNPETFRIESGSMVPIYRNMRDIAPSPNMHAVKMGKDSESVGSFPELTIRIENGVATTYQVAGTRPRTGDAETDARMFEELIADPKEVAEHRMLVDLARNDLERSSIPGTVYIPEGGLMHRLDAGRVMHIATEIRSRVNGIPPLAALLRIAPMGTVSGAPKVRSLQIIRGHEQKTRGHYAGSFGFVDFQGNAEFVVGLRSLGRQKDILTLQSGAGIVFDSVPRSEYLETVQKKGVGKRAIEPFLQSA